MNGWLEVDLDNVGEIVVVVTNLINFYYTTGKYINAKKGIANCNGRTMKTAPAPAAVVLLLS